ncbi:uncharacterized protein ACA1_270610 [Acanthamoeba castellanii str. Neff]|uniref:Uncharacterized protein n=1 Tax=Acanthamoeba castellanii (strain ATCC 30010 / Neff) TaxID=1257118 RepID=L8H542_ACACF|nr:uncharacterized protein ACA1_270610 [Acanthamoeba castellanii str. Neff]ELR19566.1 hypothetical protein ACA1_270610 [Acanthamoeba castellanii str. Neff]
MQGSQLLDEPSPPIERQRTGPESPSRSELTLDALLSALSIDNAEPSRRSPVSPHAATPPRVNWKNKGDEHLQPRPQPRPQAEQQHHHQAQYKGRSLRLSSTKKIAELEQAKCRIQTVLREIARAARMTHTSAITNNGDQLKMGVTQIASGAQTALKEHDYGQFACCIHLLCKVTIAVHQHTQDAAHAALDLLSLLAEAEVEQMRLGAMDPVAAIARRAHVSLAAQLTDRLELHLSRWVVLVNERVTLASSRSSSSPSRSSSVSTSLPSFSPPQSPHAAESDSGDVHYHIACYLGLEGILRERQSLYEHLGQSPEQVGDDVKASVRLTITMTKGLLDVIRVNDEQHQVTLRRLKTEIVNKLREFTEAAMGFLRDYDAAEDLEQARAAVLPALDDLLHELHDARDFMLDADMTDEDTNERAMANAVPTVRRMSDSPKPQLAVPATVSTPRTSSEGATSQPEGPGVLTDHVRKLTSYATFTLPELLSLECAIQLAHRHRPKQAGSAIDTVMKPTMNLVEQLIAAGFEFSDLLAQVLARKQRALYRDSLEGKSTRRSMIAPVSVEALFNEAELKDFEEAMRRAAKVVKIELNLLLSHLKTLKDEHDSAASEPAAPPALPPRPPADPAVVAEVQTAVKEIVQVTQPMLEFCKAEPDDFEPGRPEGHDQATVSQFSARLADLLSRLLVHVPDAAEKRLILRQALEVGEVVKRFRADKTRGELRHYLVEEHRFQQVVLTIHQFLTTLKRVYALLRDGRP